MSKRAPDADKLTLEDFVTAHWRPYLTRKNIKPSTLASYESALESHILPAFGKLKLVEIAPLHVESFVQEKIRSGRAAKTVRNLVAVLQSIFSLAVDDDLIEKSPVRDKHKPTVATKEKSAWSGEQVRAILQGCAGGLSGAVHDSRIDRREIGRVARSAMEAHQSARRHFADRAEPLARRSWCRRKQPTACGQFASVMYWDRPWRTI